MSATSTATGVTVSADGVRRSLGEGRAETVRWEDLVRVTIRTTGEGPFQPDFFWLLHAQDGSGCALDSEVGAEVGLLPWLQRLPRFDNAAVIRAAATTTDETFLCWEGAPGEGRAAIG